MLPALDFLTASAGAGKTGAGAGSSAQKGTGPVGVFGALVADFAGEGATSNDAPADADTPAGDLVFLPNPPDPTPHPVRLDPGSGRTAFLADAELGDQMTAPEGDGVTARGTRPEVKVRTPGQVGIEAASAPDADIDIDINFTRAAFAAANQTPARDLDTTPLDPSADRTRRVPPLAASAKSALPSSDLSLEPETDSPDAGSAEASDSAAVEPVPSRAGGWMSRLQDAARAFQASRPAQDGQASEASAARTQAAADATASVRVADPAHAVDTARAAAAAEFDTARRPAGRGAEATDRDALTDAAGARRHQAAQTFKAVSQDAAETDTASGDTAPSGFWVPHDSSKRAGQETPGQPMSRTMSADSAAGQAPVFRAMAAARAVPAPPTGTTASAELEGAAATNSASIVRSMRLLTAEGGGDATINIEPNHFGDLKISLRVRNGQVEAQLQAESPAVRDWLQANQGVLRQALADQGLSLDRMEVIERAPEAYEPEHDPSSDRESSSREEGRPKRRRLPDNATFEVVA
jgi:flagellar hook-length control protein FliK